MFNAAQVDGYAAPILPVLSEPERIGHVEAFFAPLTREATHWAGHTSRCAGDLRGQFGKDAYAAEELVAELGAAFPSAELALVPEPRPDHAAYVGVR